MKPVKIAVVGVGNCASSLIQGISYYTPERLAAGTAGLMHPQIAGLAPSDIEVVIAFDIDKRKVGKPLAEALFARPNNTTVFCRDLANPAVTVLPGRILDGLSSHMNDFSAEETFIPGEFAEPSTEQVVAQLKSSGAQIMVNYLPVGSERATRFYAECALEAGLGLVNCIPVFIASDPVWAGRFAARGLPVIGDDVKAQVGATIVHRALADLFESRGVRVERTYQLNVGGNTDFLNMLNRERLKSKKISKTEAVSSVLSEEPREQNIHIGPSDYVPWLHDNKLCFMRLEGTGFGGVPLNLEVRLSVEDSPNSAGVVIDAIRCCKLALDRRFAGPVKSVAAYLMKHPPEQYVDWEARQMMDEFIAHGADRRPA